MEAPGDRGGVVCLDEDRPEQRDRLVAGGELDEVVVWPDPRSLTVWTGEDWFTVTVMPVAFGRWGVAVCHDEAPRRAEPVELVTRARGEDEAPDEARRLIGDALAGASPERVAVVASR